MDESCPYIMMYSCWSKTPYGECDLERLHSLESSVGTRLPKDLIGWLKDVNGGEPKYKCIEISKDWGISEIGNIYGLNDGPDYKQIDKCNLWLKGNLKDVSGVCSALRRLLLQPLHRFHSLQIYDTYEVTPPYAPACRCGL